MRRVFVAAAVLAAGCGNPAADVLRTGTTAVFYHPEGHDVWVDLPVKDDKRFPGVTAGVKARVVADPGGDARRKVVVFVLEGGFKDETVKVDRDKLRAAD